MKFLTGSRVQTIRASELPFLKGVVVDVLDDGSYEVKPDRIYLEALEVERKEALRQMRDQAQSFEDVEDLAGDPVTIPVSTVECSEEELELV